MKNLRNLTIFSSLFLLFSLAGWYNWNYISQRIYTYAFEQTRQKYGHQPLSPEREKIIHSIAKEMGITEKIIVRKMNYNALREFGYVNAFVFFYTFLNCIPLCNTPFLFVSEGFFEDLTLEEQRFLIGHELVHAHEHHTQFLNLFLMSFWLVLIVLLAFGRSSLSPFVRYLHATCGKLSGEIIIRLITVCVFYTPLLASLAYRRHIERVADRVCLERLKEYDGACKLFDRWHKDFKIPLYNSYYGLFATHPSCHERKEYCLLLKKNEGNL